MGSRNGHNSGSENPSEIKNSAKGSTLGWVQEPLASSASRLWYEPFGWKRSQYSTTCSDCILSAFLLALLALGGGVLGTTTAVESAETFVLYDQCGDAVRQIKVRLQGLKRPLGDIKRDPVLITSDAYKMRLTVLAGGSSTLFKAVRAVVTKVIRSVPRLKIR